MAVGVALLVGTFLGIIAAFGAAFVVLAVVLWILANDFRVSQPEPNGGET
jgi:type III secretory pathway component EscR